MWGLSTLPPPHFQRAHLLPQSAFAVIYRGSVVPGSVVPGSVVPGSVVPGSVVPGRVVPGRVDPGAVTGFSTVVDDRH